MNQRNKSLLLFADFPAASANQMILGSLEQKDFIEANKSNIPV